MDKLVEVLHNFLLDSKKSIGRRFGNAVMIAMVILIVDFAFGITKSIHYSNKLSRLEKIHTLKEQYQGDILTVQMLQKMQMETIHSNHYMHHFESLWSSLVSSEYNAPTNNEQQNTPQITIPKVSMWWMVLSSSLIFLFVSLLAFTAPIWSKNYNYSNIAESLTVALAFVLLSVLSTGLTLTIPILFDDYVWVNYIINFIIHILIVLILIYVGKGKLEDTPLTDDSTVNP